MEETGQLLFNIPHLIGLEGFLLNELDNGGRMEKPTPISSTLCL